MLTIGYKATDLMADDMRKAASFTTLSNNEIRERLQYWLTLAFEAGREFERAYKPDTEDQD